MFSFASFRRTQGRSVRSIVCLSLIQTSPLLQVVDPPLDVEVVQHGGPGWYDSSFELDQGLEVAEVPDLDAELDLWIDACLHLAPVTDAA